jgi:hypothetical protein
MINMLFSQRLVVLLSVFFTLIINPLKLTAAKADSLLNGLQIETKVHYGFIYPHHSAIAYLLDGNISGLELNFSTESTGRHIWEELYRFPRYGLAYDFTNFSNPEILGYAHSLFAYIDIPFYLSENKFSINYQIDLGCSYLTKKYEIYENPLNLAISSSVDVYVGLNFNARFKVSGKHEIKTGLELTHRSNGKWHSPNLGLNTVTLSAAWLYSIKPSVPVIKRDKIEDYRRNCIEIIINAGAKRDDLLNEKLYLISSIIGDYYYALSPKYAFGSGIDFFYDPSLGPTKEYEEGEAAESSDNYQVGIHLGARVRYGRMSVLLNGGYYVWANYLKYSSIYSRLGLRYAITDNIMLNLTLKAHYAIADYMEWGIGYRFNSSGK